MSSSEITDRKSLDATFPTSSPEVRKKLSELPKETQRIVLSILDPNMPIDVVGEIRELTFSACRNDFFPNLEHFVHFVVNHLPKDKYRELKEQLLSMISGIKAGGVLNSEDLQVIKSSFIELKDRLIGLLRGVSNDDLNSLRRQSDSKFNEKENVFSCDIFQLVAVYEGLDRTYEARDIHQLLVYVEMLFELGGLDKVIEVALRLQNENEQINILSEACDILIRKGKTDKLYKIISDIRSPIVRGRLSAILCDKFGLKRAELFAHGLPDEVSKEAAFTSIARRYADSSNDNIAEALRVAELIRPEKRGLAYMHIVVNLGNNLLFHLAPPMPDEQPAFKDEALTRISSNLIIRSPNNFELAYDVIGDIADERIKNNALFELVYAHTPNVEKVEKIVNAMTWSKAKAFVCAALCNLLAQANQMDKAREYAQNIPNAFRNFKIEALRSVKKRLIELERVEEAGVLEGLIDEVPQIEREPDRAPSVSVSDNKPWIRTLTVAYIDDIKM